MAKAMIARIIVTLVITVVAITVFWSPLKAAIVQFTGSVSVPASGSLTTASGAPVTFGSAPSSANGYTAGSSTYGATSASVNGPFNSDNGNSSGLGLQISGKNVVYSNGGGFNNDLYLSAPLSTGGSVFFGHVGAGAAYGSISSAGYSIGSSTYGPASATVNGTLSLLSGNASGVAGQAMLQYNTGFGGTVLWTGANPLVEADANNSYLRAPTVSGGIGLGNSASTEAFGSINASGFNTGASNYGPTSATVNGAVTITGTTAITAQGTANSTTTSYPSQPLNFQNSYWNGTAAATAVGSVQMAGSTANQPMYISAPGGLIIQAPQGTNVGVFDQNGNLSLSKPGTLYTGSSSYGPTSATVNGIITTTAGNGNDAVRYACYGAVGGCGLQSNNATISGVTSNLFDFDTVGLLNLVGADVSGNLGIAGSYHAGSSAYGPTGATVNGTLTDAYHITNSTTTNPEDVLQFNGTTRGVVGVGNGTLPTDVYIGTATGNSGGLTVLSAGAQVAHILPSGAYTTGSATYGTSVGLNGCAAAAVGDLCVARTSNSGLIEFGSGTFPQGYLDFGINHAGAWSLTNGTQDLYLLGLHASGVAIANAAGGLTIGSGAVSSYFTMSRDLSASQVTYIGPYSGTIVGGVNGGTFRVGLLNPEGDLMAIDASGNMGISGQFYAGSSIKLKHYVRPLQFDPLKIIADTDWVQFCYKSDKKCHANSAQTQDVGFIAERTSGILAGKKHDSMSLNKTVGIEGAAIKELHREVQAQKSEIARIRTSTNSARIDSLEMQVRILEVAVAGLAISVLVLFLMMGAKRRE